MILVLLSLLFQQVQQNSTSLLLLGVANLALSPFPIPKLTSARQLLTSKLTLVLLIVLRSLPRAVTLSNILLSLS